MDDVSVMTRSQTIGPVAPSNPTRVAFDPRTGQIAAQCLLLLLELFWLDFGPSLAQVLVFIAGTQAMELLRARVAREAVNWKSALSTGLSLSLLLRTHEPALWLAACAIAIGSKYLLRVNGKHLFNPSAFAIVALLLLSRQVWVSPGQWGTTLWLLALSVSMGGLILTRVARVDIALAFFAAHAGLLLSRAVWLGDPLTIPLHQLQSGSVLIFAMFMLTDPRSTPDGAMARVVFGAAVAVLAHALLFRWQVREAVFYALILISCVTPLLDRIWPGPRFVWPVQSGV
jgi:Na+-transporting NADH:ubiquinone oxidoreductase subunit NqrB